MKWEFKHNWKCFEKMMNRVMFCSCVNKRLVVFVQNISLWIKNTSIEKFKHYTATLMLVKVDVDDFMLVTIILCWCPMRMLKVQDVDDKDGQNPVLKTATNVSKLPPTNFVSNIRHQYRYSPIQRPHWCWWPMLEKVYLGDNFEDNRFL